MSNSNHIVDLPLEKIMGDRFGRYSKYIIQDRALPDVRDGLKPVQRRILYAMHEDKNTHDKNFRKSAKTVGTVIGNYHPHGDSSVYEAMVRLSQPWKMRYELIEMHGNNGSVDGDPAAAMRYTEAKLSKISAELMKEIDKDTVDFVPNFDDTHLEPTVFPAKLPNLLINGSTGISSGYATNIPPHNLHEVTDAVMYRMDHPESNVDELMKKISGPDFPTGGIVQGIDGIKNAFETGKGKVVLRGKAEIEKIKGNREQIVITEIPYEVNKANLVRKMDELHADRKVEGVQEVVDESDRKGLRIVITLKKDADSQGILNYLYKNTDLQTLYHYNLVAIDNKTPKLLSLPQILDAYIDHQKDVVTRQTSFDLKKATDRLHIVEGLIKAISVLDELIKIIRNSKNKADAKMNIVKKYEFTDAQAEAILALQLYRLTNTDITLLTEESEELHEKIKSYNLILSDPQMLLKTIKDELKYIKKAYKTTRATLIEDEIESLKINIEVTIPTERVVVSVTNEGYIKRTSLRSFGASDVEDLLIKSSDFLLNMMEIDTTDYILIFTNLGKFVAIPVYELPDIRWKDMGQHLSNLTTFEQNERIINCIPIREFTSDHNILFFTKQGMVKKSTLELYESTRFSRSLIALNLRESDEVVDVFLTNGTQDVFIATKKGYGLWFNENEVTSIGLRGLGVIGINLKANDEVINAQIISDLESSNLVILTHRGACKRMKLDSFNRNKRARRGQIMLRELKAKPHEIISFIVLDNQQEIVVYTDKEKEIFVSPYGLPINNRQSNGSFILDTDIDGSIIAVRTIIEYEIPFEE